MYKSQYSPIPIENQQSRFDLYFSNSSIQSQSINFLPLQWFNGNGILAIDFTFRIIDFDSYVPNTSYYDAQQHTIGIRLKPCTFRQYTIALINNKWSHGLRLNYWNGSDTKKLAEHLYENDKSDNFGSHRTIDRQIVSPRGSRY